MRRIVMAVVLLACSGLYAQQMKTYVMAERRQGVIELIDPVTLATVSQIHFDVPRNSVGLNGVSASSDGTRLYVEGPITEDPNGCCELYSIDLGTLQARKVAGIWGSRSREPYVISDGILYQKSEIFPRGGGEEIGAGSAFLDPTGHYLVRVSSSQSPPVLDMYDLAQGTVAHPSVPTDLGDGWHTGVVWSGNRFLLYGSQYDGSSDRLWTVSTTAAQIGPGVEVKTFGQVSGCSKVRLEGITAAGGNLFVFERFGSKIDRREFCGTKIPGGAWVVDPDTGQLLHHFAPELHFTHLVADRTEPVLYGLAAEGDVSPAAPITLVRIDARNGSILQSRNLDVDFWWMVVVPLQKAPTGEVQMVP